MKYPQFKYRKDLMREAIRPYKNILTTEQIRALKNTIKNRNKPF